MDYKDNASKNLNQKIIDNEDLHLTDAQKEIAIKKEEHYRNLYNEIFDFNQTKDFAILAKALIAGYENLTINYANKIDNNDIDYVVKFAFRDFYLLIFINMKKFFENNQFLRDLHKKVYFAENYVNINSFTELLEYCKTYLENEKK